MLFKHDEPSTATPLFAAPSSSDLRTFRFVERVTLSSCPCSPKKLLWGTQTPSQTMSGLAHRAPIVF